MDILFINPLILVINKPKGLLWPFNTLFLEAVIKQVKAFSCLFSGVASYRQQQVRGHY